MVEHTTDTAGFIEVVFALFELLGLQFAPRIRNLGDQRLYRLDRTTRYRYLQPRLKGKARIRRILARWDDFLRVAGCLNLLTNAVVVWNTLYMAAAIEELRVEGCPVQEDDLTHLSPARFEHINLLGHYRFAIDERLNYTHLRPLRHL
jgi:TnpA family transposase